MQALEAYLTTESQFTFFMRLAGGSCTHQSLISLGLDPLPGMVGYIPHNDCSFVL